LRGYTQINAAGGQSLQVGGADVLLGRLADILRFAEGPVPACMVLLPIDRCLQFNRFL